MPCPRKVLRPAEQQKRGPIHREFRVGQHEVQI
jgi:hypothetical protein